MSKENTSKQIILLGAIDDILWNDWDPIGVNDIDEARDEYQSYTPLIFDLKCNGAGKEAIAKKLHEIETGAMGLFGNIQRCNQVAEKISELSF
jgi:hypothetical protein